MKMGIKITEIERRDRDEFGRFQLEKLQEGIKKIMLREGLIGKIKMIIENENSK